MEELLSRIATYLVEAPRAVSSSIDVGPFTVFDSDGPWVFPARLRPDASEDQINASAIQRVIQEQFRRQQAPLLEWIGDANVRTRQLVGDAGLRIESRILLVHSAVHTAVVPGAEAGQDEVEVVQLDRQSNHVVGYRMVADTVFADEFGEQATLPNAAEIAWTRKQLANGQLAVVALHRDAVIGVGAATPVKLASGSVVAELSGIGVLPTFRHRAVGSRITNALVRASSACGVTLCFVVAERYASSLYVRLGFTPVGICCQATP